MRVRERAVAYKTRKKGYTYEDYLTFPEDGWGYQIIEGELVVSPSPKTIHQDILLNFGYALKFHIKKTKSGYVYLAPFDVILDNQNIVQPDILYISNKNKNILTKDNVKGAPDFVVEILSQSNKQYDVINKKDVYQKFGVSEYWIIDPENKSVDVYSLDKKQFNPYQHKEKNGTVSSKILKTFSISLQEIFDSPV